VIFISSVALRTSATQATDLKTLQQNVNFRGRKFYQMSAVAKLAYLNTQRHCNLRTLQ
jgi:hypothetical protein